MNDYHKDYTHLSKSFLTKLETSPIHAYQYMTGEKKDTDAMRFGRVYHAVIAGLKDEYIVFDEAGRPEPDKTFGSKLNKEWKDEIFSSELDVVSMSELVEINAMIEQLKANAIVQQIHAFDLMQEEAFRATIDTYKIKCKPDGLQVGRGVNNENLVIDWKTCNNIHPKAIMYDFVRYGYDVQAAMYCEIISELNGGESNMMFIFQEKSAPYDVLPVLVGWDSDTMNEGRNKWRNYYIKARECFETGIWPGVASKYVEQCLIMD